MYTPPLSTARTEAEVYDNVEHAVPLSQAENATQCVFQNAKPWILGIADTDLFLLLIQKKIVNIKTNTLDTVICLFKTYQQQTIPYWFWPLHKQSLQNENDTNNWELVSWLPLQNPLCSKVIKQSIKDKAISILCQLNPHVLFQKQMDALTLWKRIYEQIQFQNAQNVRQPGWLSSHSSKAYLFSREVRALQENHIELFSLLYKYRLITNEKAENRLLNQIQLFNAIKHDNPRVLEFVLRALKIDQIMINLRLNTKGISEEFFERDGYQGEGFTPLELAFSPYNICNYQYNCARVLIVNKANINVLSQNIYKEIYEKGTFDFIQFFINQGADVNKIQHPNQREFLTPLNVILSRCDSQDDNFPHILETIIEAGADINAKDSNGLFPLITAVQCLSLKRFTYFMKFKPQTSVTNPQNQTALMKAILSGVNALGKIRLLLASITSYSPETLNQQDLNGDTALMHAVREGYFDYARVLIENGADTSIMNSAGETALILASQFKFLPMQDLKMFAPQGYPPCRAFQPQKNALELQEDPNGKKGKRVLAPTFNAILDSSQPIKRAATAKENVRT